MRRRTLVSVPVILKVSGVFVSAGGRMCLRTAAGGGVLGDGSHPPVHKRLIPCVWHHEVFGRELVSSLDKLFFLKFKT